MTTRREAVIKAVAVLATALRVESSAALTEAYQIALADLSADEVASAMAKALKACKFMPSPSELLAFAGRAPRDIAAEATLAWDAVRRAMDSLDVYGNPNFGPIVNAVVRNLGGWTYLCEQKLSELEWRRKDFERVYRLWVDKDASVLPEGGPLFGYWRNAKVTRIEIAGLPVHPVALPPIETPQAQQMREVVRELAESKSPADESSAKQPSMLSGPCAGIFNSRPPRAPVRITEDEKAAAIARMTEQLAARSVST